MIDNLITSLVKRLVICLCILLSLPGKGQLSSADIRFDHISNKDGLSQNTVTALIQDRKGFIWIGTEDGLNRFNGKDFKIFGFSSLNKSSNEFNFITSLFEDSKGFIWVGTIGDGLYRFDWENENFEKYILTLDSSDVLSTKYVSAVIEDSQGNLWIGTGGGLVKLNANLIDYTYYRNEPDNQSSLSSNDILSLAIDGNKYLWVGTRFEGLNKLDFSNETFTRYNTQSETRLISNTINTVSIDNYSQLLIGMPSGMQILNKETNQIKTVNYFTNTTVNRIFSDSKENIWVGSETGLYLKESENSWIHFLNDPSDPNSLLGSRINNIVEDYSGTIWIGTRFNGINKYDPRKHKFRTIKADPKKKNSIPDNIIRCFWEDQSNQIWIGTTEGLTSYNRRTETYETFVSTPGKANSLPHSDIRAILGDSANNLWIGTRDGLSYFDPIKRVFKNYKYENDNINSLTGNHIRVLVEDRNYLWIGTHNNGLNRLDKSTGIIKRYYNESSDEAIIDAKRITAFHLEKEGTLWIGTSGNGVIKMIYNEEGEKLVTYLPNDNPGGISSNIIKSFLEDVSGNFWIATANGFCRMDREKETFETYLTDQGLANKMVYGILQDDEGKLWMSTNNGLSQFDITEKSFKNYDEQDGLQANEFNTNAFFKASDGTLFFGGIKGMNVFDPNDIDDFGSIPKIIISDFQLFYHSQNPEAGGILSKHVSELDEIILEHDQNVFSFEFELLDYSNPEKNRYRYFMEGFDSDWIEANNRNFATYTNLSPGSYTFRVTGSNSDGVWDREAAVINIIIHAPWWKALWFRFLSVIFLLSLPLGYLRIRQLQIISQRKRLEYKVAQRTTELMRMNSELKAYDHMISHDLKGPIGNINMMVSYLAEQPDLNLSKENLEMFNEIRKSTKRAINLITDILSFASADKLETQLEKVDLEAIVNEAISGHALTISNCNAQVSTRDLPVVEMGVPVKIYQLFYNLIGNALKFQKSDSIPVISIYGRDIDGKTEIVVEDNGIGFEQKYAKEIFGTLYRLHNTSQYEGSGIGLATCERIAHYHQWTIRAESEVGVGSKFIITL